MTKLRLGVNIDRIWSLPLFSAGCFAVCGIWDIALVAASYFAREHVDAVPAPIALLIVPIFLCAGLGYVAGEWRAENSPIAMLGAAVWCLVTPGLAYSLFILLGMSLEAILHPMGAS